MACIYAVVQKASTKRLLCCLHALSVICHPVHSVLAPAAPASSAVLPSHVARRPVASSEAPALSWVLPAQVLFAVASYQLPADFSPDNTDADWSASFTINQPGVTLQWQFAFAAYSNFAPDAASLAKLQPLPVAGAVAAGTPSVDTYNGDVLAGGRNLGAYEGGFYQYTGEYCQHVMLPNLCAT